MKKIQKNAGFLIRFTAISLDVLIFCSISIVSSLICIEKVKIVSQLIDDIEIYLVKNDFMYWMWLILLVILLLIQFLLIPFLSKGKTIGMFLTHLTINFKNQDYKKIIFKRFEFGALLWIIVIFSFIILTNPELVNKKIIYSFVNKNYQEKNDAIKEFLNSYRWTNWETFAFTISSAMSPLIILFHLISLLSSGFKKEKVGLIDRLSQSQIVYTNKFENIEEIKIDIPKPEKNKEIKITWKT